MFCFAGASFAVENCCGLNSPGNDFVCGPHDNDPSRYGNCTWYARYKRPEVDGICTGNAVVWFNQAQNGGLPVGQIPAVGSLAVFNWTASNGINYGHVAYVESVNSDGSFYVSEMGWNTWDCEHYSTWTRNSLDGLIGFIFPADTITSFTFPNHSAQGWTCGFDTQTVDQTQADLNTWMIVANGSNPGVASPSFANGINTDQFRTLKFSARVDGSGSDSPGYIWIKDNAGDWNHGVYFGSVPRDYNYHEYTANLAGAFSNLDISQISIELTENGGYEHWIFDWVKLVSSYYHWDFTDSQLGWTIRQHGQFVDFFDNTFWRIQPTGKQPQIVSPYLDSISSDYIQIGIRYSAQGSNDTAIARAYFDIGSDFGSIYSASSILRDGTTKTVIFDIPSSAIGNIQRVMFDLFDNDDYENRTIAINKISFLKGDDTDDPDFIISGSGGGLYEPENLTATASSTSQINLSWNRGLNPSEYANLRYRIYRNGASIATTANTSYSNMSLSAGTQYCYKITAYIDDNESDYSDQVCATTLSGGGDALATPTNLRVIELGENLIRIAWDEVENAVTYKVVKNDANTFFTGGDTTFTDQGVQPDETVNYKVWAFNSPVYSDGYAEINATSLPIGPFEASFTATPEFGPAPLTVEFVSTSTGGPTDFFWEILNNNLYFSSDAYAVHTFTEPGTYTVRLETYRYQMWSNAYKTIVVEEPDPLGPPDLLISELTISELTPEIISYRYTLANSGESAADLNGVEVHGYFSADESIIESDDLPVSIYSHVGELLPGESVVIEQQVDVAPLNFRDKAFFVLGVDIDNVLTETDESNNLLTVDITSWIAGFPEQPVLGADFIADVVSGETSLTVNFIDLSVGEFDSWDWDFGDRYRSTEPSPTHIFVRSGTYTVSLTVSGLDGTYTVTKEDYITVSYAPRPPRLR
ncbi:CHAP domain-containing protein [Candidatus Parcubacteria bacterium]|nr:CHAP domain-containing protein [Candidatus Parcubacteria bacterium]